ncbi:hypothetical protein [Chitinophaga defluvii]|uniref:DUF4037 domain-containing protein n=1 Tax=Chitinophaga defluvii TaxID=3163343 RepID=A0ABV2T817_9BACT
MENFLLTPAEQEVAYDANWIYLKNSIIEKVMLLMGRLQTELATHAAAAGFPFPENCLEQGAKISKGERYQELPYVILDFPRYFSKERIFAFRTMFWWGHYFSCTLHLAGEIKTAYHAALVAGYPLLAANDFQVYTQEDPWYHDFENGNYRPVGTFTVDKWEAMVYRQDFIKLAKPFALNRWEKIIPDVAAAYAALLALLQYKTG